MNTQPEALRLADECDAYIVDFEDAAAELRRLHAETTNQQDWLVEWRKCEAETKRLHALNQELLEALRKCSEQLTRLGYSANHADAAIAKATGENT